MKTKILNLLGNIFAKCVWGSFLIIFLVVAIPFAFISLIFEGGRAMESVG